MKKVCLVGPFDRYNYGDVVFANVVSRMLDSRSFDIRYYGYSKIDLTNVGGYRVDNISKIFVKDFLSDGDVIIVVGGDVLCVNYRLVNYQLSCNKYIKMCEGFILKESGLRKKFNVKNKFPWIFDPDDFDADIKIAYNAVGGLFDSFTDEKYKLLTKANYVSCRDSYDSKMIKNSSADSAFIISDLYRLIKSNDKYIVFQIQYSSYIKNKKIIINQLKKLIIETDIYLVVLGYASGHDDLKAYIDIKKKIRDVKVLDNLDIFQIMNVIGNSNFFIGTSLHGNLTAYTYNVPHFAIDKNIRKLRDYYKDYEEKNNIYDFKDIYQIYMKLKNTKINSNRLESIKKEVYNNFDKMFECVLYDK